MRLLAAALVVAAATGVAEVLFRVLGEPRLSTVFLGSVLLVAVTLGASSAIFAAFLAFFVFNFYLVEPRFTVQFATAEDFLNLVIFLAAALLTGGLAGRLRDEAQRSRARARTLSTLFDASQVLSATEREDVLRDQLGAIFQRAVHGPAAMMPDGSEEPDERFNALDERERKRIRELLQASQRAPAPGATILDGVWRARPLRSQGRRLGVALWRVPEMTMREADDLEQLTGTLADLGTAALSRARLSEEKAHTEALARTETLRTALLSSISHDLRTPLAGILASATSLLEYDQQFDADTRRDLASNIQEEAERLNRFVANLLQMTKLDAGVLEPNWSETPAVEAAMRAVEWMEKRKGRRRLTVVRVGEELHVRADPVLLEQALTNVVDNAVTYSPDGSEVSLWIDRFGGTVQFEVTDEGPGVAAGDLPRIFDKFYRASTADGSAQGTGLGLSITKGLIEAMGGTVEARARDDGKTGLSVLIRLPEGRSS